MAPRRSPEMEESMSIITLTKQWFTNSSDKFSKPGAGASGKTRASLLTFLPLDKFPKTRYQGSKRRLLVPLQDVFAKFKPGTAIDLYSGTATVSLLLRLMGWRVVANDFLLYNNATARLMLNGPPTGGYSVEKARQELRYLLLEAPLKTEPLVSKNFASIYFHTDENLEIDRFCQNVSMLPGGVRDLYVYAIGQALLMKRPYNLFHRANLNMRTRNVERSFGNITTWNKSILEHGSKIIARILQFPFAGKDVEHVVTNHNTLYLDLLPDAAELIYLDPPYLNQAGANVNYCHFYHFLDGLCKYQLFDEYNEQYPHRPIVLKPSAWLNNASALEEFRRVIEKWPRSTIVVSYRSDGRPYFNEIADVFRSGGRHFQSIDAHDYKYALSIKKDTKELFLISAPA